MLKYRKAQNDIPIIFMTACDEENKVVKWFLMIKVLMIKYQNQ
ncbi:hypothetical protein [Clostridium butyricum]|nr:hypothetical protein [Clostridium butyricum]